MHASRRIVGFLIGLSGSWAVAAAGQPPPTREAEFSARVSVGYVLVPVVVEKRSRPVRDLDLDDFRLYVDGRRVRIESLDHGPELPLNLVILQDLSGSMANDGKIELSRHAVSRLLARSRAGDQFALASFAADRTAVEVEPTRKTESVLLATRKWSCSGTTALHDAVASLPGLTRQLARPRSAVLLLSDGDDNASRTNAALARAAVRHAELPVYVFEIGGALVTSPDERLRGLADASGGRYSFIDSRESIEPALTELYETLRHQYLLGFTTATSGPRRYHELRVETDKKKHRVTARRGYEGPPPEMTFEPTM